MSWAFGSTSASACDPLRSLAWLFDPDDAEAVGQQLAELAHLLELALAQRAPDQDQPRPAAVPVVGDPGPRRAK
jgi:hypothetical protein